MSIAGGLVPSLRVGPTLGGDGTLPPQRADKEGATVACNNKGKYAEPSTRGQLFCASVGAAGVAPGTALGAAAALALYNPSGSQVRLEVCKVAAGFISGTLGAGTIYHTGYNAQGATALSGGTALTPSCMDIGNTAASKAKAGAGSSLAGTPGVLYPFCSVGAELATTPVGIYQSYEDVDGAITIEPGCAWALEGVAAAGTTPLMSFGVAWREVPLLTN